MTALRPTSIATIIYLIVFALAASTTIRRFSKRIQLDDTAPSETEIEAIRLAKELDGDAIKPKEYEDSIRLRRSLLVFVAALALALNVAEVAYAAVYEGMLYRRILQSCSLTIASSLLWIVVLYLAFDGMVGVHHWFAITTASYVTVTTLLTNVSILIIPQNHQNNFIFLIIHLCVSLIATSIALTTPSGPLRKVTTPQGTFLLARVGQKGRTVISMIWFTHALPLIKIAKRKGHLDEDDTPVLGSDMSAHLLYLRFTALYEQSMAKSTPRRIPTTTLRVCWPLLRTIIIINRPFFITFVILSAISGLSFYAPSYVTYRIVSLLQEQEKNGETVSGIERLRLGLPYCLLLAVSALLPTMIMGQVVTFGMQWLRNRIRTQLNTAIFAKALRRKDASGGEKKAEESGSDSKDDQEGKQNSFASKTQVVNLASIDSERFSMLIYLITFFMAPVEIVTGGFFAIKLLGWGAVIGIAASILFQPLVFYFGKLEAHFQGLQQETRDRKTSLINEVLHAIRMIKFNAWEFQTSARVKLVRQEELKYQRLLFLLDVAQNLIVAISPNIVILVAYGWYTLVEKKPLTPAVAFTAMSVLQEMRFALTQIPDGISQLIQSLVSLQRIQQYLEGDEVEMPQPGQQKGVQIRNASIEWPRMGGPASRSEPSTSFTLHSIDIEFASDALNLIVGKIGSGKTLLLRALLGEADVVRGSVSCPRSLPSSIGESVPKNEEDWLRQDQCCYVPQTAFLINASLKENILFGLPLLESRYRATLDACGLLPDLLLLEDGDETEIGENGIGLSGGQKIRVTLARATYGRGATVLLDDCLSAVDAHTADHIHKTLLRGPLFANRTVILVTHQVQLVAQSAEKIVMLDNNQVRFQGNPMDFMNSDLYNGLIEDQEEAEKNEKLVDITSEDVTPATTAPPSPQSSSTNLPKDEIPVKGGPPEQNPALPRKLVTTEKRAKGAVLLSIYACYISAAGGLFYAVLLVAVFAATNGFAIVTARWLQYWSSDAITDHPKHTNEWWIAIWAALWAVSALLEFFQLGLLCYGSLRAGRKLFMAMLDAILNAPLRFHDTVSRGRLLNRFSSDFAEADSEIVSAFRRMGDELFHVIIGVSVIAVGSGMSFVVALALMVPIYVIVGRLYMTAVRDMKRLSSTTKSPILSTFSDVVSGVSVIRAFGGSKHFFRILAQRIEFNVTFQFWTNDLRWWYEQIFGTLSFILILFAALIILLNPEIGAAQAGFIFSFLIQINHQIIFLLQSYTNLEQKLVSVERIVEYTRLEPEKEEAKAVVPAAWPTSGAVEIKDLHVRYASELPDVLKGINVSIPAGAKVGVVGPTGCGKSTLASSFFRFVEISAGSINIDGIDIGTAPLKDLRSRIQIVPQDPIILSGPLRSSVDVQNEFSDEEVRRSLVDVQLLKGSREGDTTPQQSNLYDLQHVITEGGGNLSNGEKQLLCLARAVLRQSKLIIFDEATSSVDFDTDQVISQTIRQAFKASTIITIAHRLRTIIDYDYVIVMDDGKVLEFDSPEKLLAEPESRFYKLCKASGRREFAHLKSMGKG